MGSVVRYTDIAKLLESFLDDWEGDISPNLFKELEALAEQVDDSVKEKDLEIEELNEKIEELEEQIKEMESGE